MIGLALRPEGVAAEELNSLTRGKGAPWRWLFSNLKSAGYADCHGYQFSAAKSDNKRGSYCLSVGHGLTEIRHHASRKGRLIPCPFCCQS